MNMKDVLTTKEIENAIHLLSKDSGYPTGPLIWIDNERSYRNGVACKLGFRCSDDELEMAKSHPERFIKMSLGVNLYLTKYLTANENQKD